MTFQKITIEPHITVKLKEVLEEISEVHSKKYVCNLEITVSAHAHVMYELQNFFVDSNVSCIIRHITFILVGDYAQVTCTGQLKVAGSTVHDIRIVQIHKAAHTTSLSSIKMVLDDQAKVSYSGKVLIENSASRANAVQEFRALVISQNAVAMAQPELEILHNDVTCKHGVAIAYINKEYLLYLMTRGLSHEAAKDLIVQSFLSTAST